MHSINLDPNNRVPAIKIIDILCLLCVDVRKETPIMYMTLMRLNKVCLKILLSTRNAIFLLRERCLCL